jgi:hypothetical protein
VPQGGSVKQLHLDSRNCLIAFSHIGEKKQCLVWQRTGYSEFSLKYKQQFSGVKQVDVDDENIALVVTDFDQPMILQALLIPTETFVLKSGIPLPCNTPFRYLSDLFFTIYQDHLWYFDSPSGQV